MTQPQQTAHPVQPPPASVPLVQRIAEILLAGYAISKTADAIVATIKAQFAAITPPSTQAVEAALGLASTAHAPRPRLAANGFDDTTKHASAVMRRAANGDLYYRAAYVAKASARIQADLDAGLNLGEALRREAENFQAHREARENRLEVAARIGSAAELYGERRDGRILLGWYRDPASPSEPECIDADGCNFYADEPPLIGYPGAVHPRCRCKPGPAHPDAPLVDEALGHRVSVASLRSTARSLVRMKPRHLARSGG